MRNLTASNKFIWAHVPIIRFSWPYLLTHTNVFKIALGQNTSSVIASSFAVGDSTVGRKMDLEIINSQVRSELPTTNASLCVFNSRHIT